MNILLVRLGALGDIVHAIPAAAALRAAHPSATIDWVVDARHFDMVRLVTVIDRAVTLDAPTIPAWLKVVRELRSRQYDVALDLQGLMKSAVLARVSGAPRVIGFSIWHLREKSARPFYSEVEAFSGPGGAPPEGPESTEHVVHKNLRLLRTLGVDSTAIDFPLRAVGSAVADDVRREFGDAPFVLLNPGAAWPNKRWYSDRFGAVAAFLRDVRGMRSLVLWGPGEAPIAHAVAEASEGAAVVAPPTTIVDLLALSRVASLMVSGDTGPVHIAAAAGTPILSIFGPTDPQRNGPLAPDDISISRYPSCGCHYQRRCRESVWCLTDVSVNEVIAGIQQRLSKMRVTG
jgi:ADP-heptose:LPS heptosyltransferase